MQKLGRTMTKSVRNAVPSCPLLPLEPIGGDTLIVELASSKQEEQLCLLTTLTETI
jgi:hypothetical protein